MIFQITANQEQLLKYLSIMGPANLATLSAQLDCSPDVVELELRQLIALSFPIEELMPECFAMRIDWQPLNPTQLAYALNISPTHIHAFIAIDSTNNYLKNPIFSGQNLLCIAEMQTQGRGRFGRYWRSPFGVNLYLSLRLCIPLNIEKLKGLSLMTGLAVCAALDDYPIMIKWPNDLWINQKKCAGILIELCSCQATQTEVIIGLGLNINEALQPEWTSLAAIKGKQLDRQIILQSVVQSIHQHLEIFYQQGLDGFREQWQAKDQLYLQQVKVQKADKIFVGQAQGINLDGHLLVKTTDGEVQAFDGGEVTIKL